MRCGDRIKQWIPVNEPNVASLMGYALGMHAPGKALMFDALPAAHHVLLAPGKAVHALPAVGAKQHGCATNHAPMWPEHNNPAALAAPRTEKRAVGQKCVRTRRYRVGPERQ